MDNNLPLFEISRVKTDLRGGLPPTLQFYGPFVHTHMSSMNRFSKPAVLKHVVMCPIISNDKSK